MTGAVHVLGEFLRSVGGAVNACANRRSQVVPFLDLGQHSCNPRHGEAGLRVNDNVDGVDEVGEHGLVIVRIAKARPQDVEISESLSRKRSRHGRVIR